mgnify:CR=1 FL=1
MNKIIKLGKLNDIEKENLIRDIKSDKIFIYPTDTVYGLGCNALIKRSVERIREIKGRDGDKPLSVIAPSKEWIYENLIASKEEINKYLPGKYTLILRKKDFKFLDYVSKSETLGVRMPKQDFAELVKKAEAPFITTSANLSGEKPASSIGDINKEILNKADLIIDSGIINGKPSTIIFEDGSILER